MIEELTLRTHLAALEASRPLVEFWLTFCTWAVVAGVVLEVPVVLLEYWEELSDFWRGTIHTPEKPSLLLFVVGVFATSLVAAGVTGELKFQSKLGVLETQIEDTADSIISKVSIEAKNANASAVGAMDASEKVKKQADVIAGEADKLAEEDKQIESRLVDADKNLEAEKGKRLKVAESLLQRTFRDQSGAIAALSKLPKMTAVFLYLDEHEVISTAEQINFVLTELGWTTARIHGGEGRIRDGVQISVGWMAAFIAKPPYPVKSPEEAQAFRTALVKTPALLSSVFTDSGIEAEQVSVPGPIWGNLRQDIVLIMVGPRPNTAVEETLKELGPQPPPTPLSNFPGAIVNIGPHGKYSSQGSRTPIPEAQPQILQGP